MFIQVNRTLYNNILFKMRKRFVCLRLVAPRSDRVQNGKQTESVRQFKSACSARFAQFKSLSRENLSLSNSL